MKIKDEFGRTFKTLRISLTNHCNFECTYCVNEETKKTPTKEKNTFSSSQLIHTVAIINNILGLESIRLTGGEPTLYKEIVPLIQNLKALQIPIKLTTNGYKLKELISQLHPNDIHSINISLDALDENIFQKISKKSNLQRVLDGIESCLDAGIKVKLNSVIIRNLNDSQILPLLEYAMSKNISIRFLELMKMGHIYETNNMEGFYPERELLNVIAQKYSFKKVQRLKSATANYWELENGYPFGIIANESSPFCNDCNRLRINTEGYIFGCLSNAKGINIAEFTQDEEKISNALKEALKQKQPYKFSGSTLNMIDIGG